MPAMKPRTLTTLLVAGVVALTLTGCKKNIRDDSVTTPPEVSSKMDEGELFAVTPGGMGESDLAGGAGGTAGAAGTAGGEMGEMGGVPGEPGAIAGAAGIEDVFFAFDSSDLSSAARVTLANDANVMSRMGGDYQIEGHCDERGSAEYNLALGDRRARAVKDYLVSLGVDPGRLSTISYGEERPFAQGHDEAAWAQNRRGHFVAR
jgi:peptidoglycan-associated lipoprotein